MELTRNMLISLDLESGPEPADACIFRYVFLGDQLLISYKSYDHHNNPREVALLEEREGNWDIVKHGLTFKGMKYDTGRSADTSAYDEMMQLFEGV